MKVYSPQSLKTALFRCLLRSLCSFITICRWERSPTTTVLSTSLCAMRCDALCRESCCLLRFCPPFLSSTLYIFEKRRSSFRCCKIEANQNARLHNKEVSDVLSSSHYKRLSLL